MAKKILHTRDALSERELVEVKIWEVPKSEDFPEGLKYSFVYIKDGERILGYDNERGKSHHRHFKGKETDIEFESIWKLLEKFKKEVQELSKNSLPDLKR